MSSQKDDQNKTLANAAKAGQLSVVKSILEEKDININKHIQGKTVLQHAAEANQLEMVNYLLSKGASSTVRDKKGKKIAFDYATDEDVKIRLSLAPVEKAFQEAIGFAKFLSPRTPPDNSRDFDDAWKVFKKNIDDKFKDTETVMNSWTQRIKDILSQTAHLGKNKDESLQKIQAFYVECRHVMLAFVSRHHIVESAAKGTMPQYGTCDVRNTFAWAYLSTFYPELSVERVEMIHKLTKANHTFLLIGRNGEDRHELKSSYAYICDAYGEGRYYSTQRIPSESCASAIDRDAPYTVKIYPTQFHSVAANYKKIAELFDLKAKELNVTVKKEHIENLKERYFEHKTTHSPSSTASRLAVYPNSSPQTSAAADTQSPHVLQKMSPYAGCYTGSFIDSAAADAIPGCVRYMMEARGFGDRITDIASNAVYYGIIGFSAYRFSTSLVPVGVSAAVSGALYIMGTGDETREIIANVSYFAAKVATEYSNFPNVIFSVAESAVGTGMVEYTKKITSERISAQQNMVQSVRS